MIDRNPMIYVVDDDASVCRSIERLLLSRDYRTKAFTSAHDFLSLKYYERPACLVLDLAMPDVNGIEVQEKLIASDISLPIIFISGNATIPASVRAMKAGAVNFIEKPFDHNVLIAEIEKSIQQDVKISHREMEILAIKQCIDTLTPRENEVFKQVITGKLNKQIAAELGVCEKTIKVHRANMMKKMHVRSVAELVRLSASLATFPMKAQHLCQYQARCENQSKRSGNIVDQTAYRYADAT